MTKDEALKMAIDDAITKFINDILDDNDSDSTWQSYAVQSAEMIRNRVKNACKEALEQPAQEPVGYIDKEQLNRWEKLRGTPYESPERAYIGFSKIPYKSNLTDCSLAVYTHPAPSWQGLSDDEILTKAAQIVVERHYKEKNYG